MQGTASDARSAKLNHISKLRSISRILSSAQLTGVAASFVLIWWSIQKGMHAMFCRYHYTSSVEPTKCVIALQRSAEQMGEMDQQKRKMYYLFLSIRFRKRTPSLWFHFLFFFIIRSDVGNKQNAPGLCQCTEQRKKKKTKCGVYFYSCSFQCTVVVADTTARHRNCTKQKMNRDATKMRKRRTKYSFLSFNSRSMCARAWIVLQVWQV